MATNKELSTAKAEVEEALKELRVELTEEQTEVVTSLLNVCAVNDLAHFKVTIITGLNREYPTNISNSIVMHELLKEYKTDFDKAFGLDQGDTFVPDLGKPMKPTR